MYMEFTDSSLAENWKVLIALPPGGVGIAPWPMLDNEWQWATREATLK
jgi:hypothetical protein